MSVGADRFVVVSSDSHAGASLLGYRPYLDPEWRDDFDAWAASYVDPWADLESGDSDVKGGLASGTLDANWDSDLRQRQIEPDGVVGEVLFPNTAPPFFPVGSLLAGPPKEALDYQRRLAGLRAHNRWLADFCSELPGRRAGVMQIMLNDVDDAVAEVRAGRDAGLTGGVLLPAIPSGVGLPPIFDSTYEPLWAACSDLDVPVNHHSGNAFGDDMDSDEPAAASILFLEVRQVAHRPLWHLIFAGAFDRHPRLKLVLTEQGAGWIEGTLRTLDFMFHRMHVDGAPEKMFGYEAASRLTRPPSEYFAEHCYIGASFFTAVERSSCADHLDRIMWGSDYPHSEGTYPYSKAALNRTLSGCAVDEAASVIGTTAASVYGLDHDALARAAALHGPTVGEVTGPRGAIPEGAARCVVFDPLEVPRSW